MKSGDLKTWKETFKCKYPAYTGCISKSWLPFPVLPNH